MKFLLLVGFILTSCMVFEVMAYALEDAVADTDRDPVHRVPRGIRDRKKSGECRYKKGPWDDCDSATNLERRTLTLKRGDSTCEETKVITRKCKKACKYEKGQWSDCEVGTNTRSRTDTLKPKSYSSCQPTRTITKKCKKVCKYSKHAAWSECDATTGKKTKVLVLTGGDAHLCEANKKVTKPCRGGRKGVNKGKQVDDEDDEYEDEE